MKHLKTFEDIDSRVEPNYKFNIGDIVKLKHEYLDRLFKIIDRKNRRQNYEHSRNINMYFVETIDDYLDEENFELSKWKVNKWEYQSKIRNLTPKELKQYNLEQDIIKFNI